MEHSYIYITLYRSELLYHIEQVAFITGDVLKNPAEVKEQANIQDIARSDRVDKTTLEMNRAWVELRAALSPYLEENAIYDQEATNALEILDEYNVTFKVPEGFNAYNKEAVRTALHEYVVNSALASWFDITKKDEAQLYREKAAQELANAKRYLNMRTTPRRLSKSPPLIY